MSKKKSHRSCNVSVGSSADKFPITFRKCACGKGFPGALFDGQPDDQCYDCFRDLVGPDPGSALWQQLTRRMPADEAYKVLILLKDLEEAGTVKILVKH